MAGMRMEVTLSETTVDQLYEDLGKLRQVGFGAYGIEWHTSRSHLGKQITMSLVEEPAPAPATKATRKEHRSEDQRGEQT
jgi:hypothetical protein